MITPSSLHTTGDEQRFSDSLISTGSRAVQPVIPSLLAFSVTFSGHGWEDLSGDTFDFRPKKPMHFNFDLNSGCELLESIKNKDESHEKGKRFMVLNLSSN